MILIILKTTFQQKKLIKTYKNFRFEHFKSDLHAALIKCKVSYDTFDSYFISSLNKNTPEKKKILRGNENPPMNKNLRHAIVKQSTLKSKANKTKNPPHILNYRKQCNMTKLS